MKNTQLLQTGESGRASLKGLPLEWRPKRSQPCDGLGEDPSRQKEQETQDVCRSKRRPLGGTVRSPARAVQRARSRDEASGYRQRWWKSHGRVLSREVAHLSSAFRFMVSSADQQGNAGTPRRSKVHTFNHEKKGVQDAAGGRPTVLIPASPGLCVRSW